MFCCKDSSPFSWSVFHFSCSAHKICMTTITDMAVSAAICQGSSLSKLEFALAVILSNLLPILGLTCVDHKMEP